MNSSLSLSASLDPMRTAAAYVIIILFLSKAALHIGVALTEHWPVVLKREKDCADRLGDKD